MIKSIETILKIWFFAEKNAVWIFLIVLPGFLRNHVLSCLVRAVCTTTGTTLEADLLFILSTVSNLLKGFHGKYSLHCP